MLIEPSQAPRPFGSLGFADFYFLLGTTVQTMKKFTVVILYPDHSTENFGETFMTTVESDAVFDAQRRAQWECAKGCYEEEEFTFEEALEQGLVDLDDFAIVAVIEGEHQDVKNLDKQPAQPAPVEHKKIESKKFRP